MKRDMDLVRLILMRIEDNFEEGAVPPFGLQGLRPEQIRYHVQLMTEDGLIENAEVTLGNSTGADEVPLVLTAKGHDFLDLARDRDRWNKAHRIIRKVGSAPVAVWMKVLNDLLLKDLGTVS